MTQFKAVLLLLSCALLYSIAGCSSSGTTATTPNGFLYAANSSRPGSMAAFTLTTGALAEIIGSPFTTGGNAPYTLAAVSTKFLYAGVPANGGVINRVLHRPVGGSVPGGILLMPIKSDHTLDNPQMFAAGGDYDPIAVTPDGKFLYAADLSTNHLAAFSIDSSKGSLTGIGPQGPPPGVPVGPDPFSVIVDPSGKFVFVANADFSNPSNRGSVSVFSINGDGTLAAVSSSPFPINSGAAHPSALTISSDSKFLFIASLDDNVYVENIAADGTLSPIPCPSSCALPAGSAPLSIALSTDGGNSIYTGNAGTHTVSFFLNCTQSPPPTNVATGSTPCPADGSIPLVLQPTGGANISGPVGVILPDPTSTPASTVGSITTPAIAPGHFLYVTDYDHGTIVVFFVTSTTNCTSSSCSSTPGTLTQSGSSLNTGGVNPFGLAIAH